MHSPPVPPTSTMDTFIRPCYPYARKASLTSGSWQQDDVPPTLQCDSADASPLASRLPSPVQVTNLCPPAVTTRCAAPRPCEWVCGHTTSTAMPDTEYIPPHDVGGNINSHLQWRHHRFLLHGPDVPGRIDSSSAMICMICMIWLVLPSGIRIVCMIY